ncbi:hypothetical protein [Stenotrophomonas maltophilia]|uniref:hypothetical protein n=1 Tax=Stenotrophomonas maltophilia TaxID=40324 RepID=UPI0020C7D275|nr:hypothetical protein [Stenotrophomonas maltophilia]
MKAVGRLLFCKVLACSVLMTLSAVPAVGAPSSERAHPRAQDAIGDWLAAFNAGSLEALQAFADICEEGRQRSRGLSRIPRKHRPLART